jgi:protein tyrosine phosphatase (PTP) superfamily phosphohydrolase (DUF442 family)
MVLATREEGEEATEKDVQYVQGGVAPSRQQVLDMCKSGADAGRNQSRWVCVSRE